MREIHNGAHSQNSHVDVQPPALYAVGYQFPLAANTGGGTESTPNDLDDTTVRVCNRSSSFPPSWLSFMQSVGPRDTPGIGLQHLDFDGMLIDGTYNLSQEYLATG